MPIYESAPVSERAEVQLECWSIREADTGDRHFVGVDVETLFGRMSTRIVSFDSRARVGVTASGRRYVLLGRGGSDADAEYVWARVTRALGIKQWRNITPELCPDWQNSMPAAKRLAEGSERKADEGSPDKSL